jgi:hypothetical protein
MNWRRKKAEARHAEAHELVEENAAVRVASAFWHELQLRLACAKRKARRDQRHQLLSERGVWDGVTCRGDLFSAHPVTVAVTLEATA